MRQAALKIRAEPRRPRNLVPRTPPPSPGPMAPGFVAQRARRVASKLLSALRARLKVTRRTASLAVRVAIGDGRAGAFLGMKVHLSGKTHVICNDHTSIGGASQ
jgi:hypothetical protein